MEEEREFSPSPSGARSQDIVVFIVRRDTECAECRRALDHGSFLRVEKGRALCLECADLDRLEYLPRGDPVVTRRATKYSKLRAVVVEWSRSRNGYERQGILVRDGVVRGGAAVVPSDEEVPMTSKRAATAPTNRWANELRVPDTRRVMAGERTGLRSPPWRNLPHRPEGAF